MGDFLSNLANRSVDFSSNLKPKTPSLFEPQRVAPIKLQAFGTPKKPHIHASNFKNAFSSEVAKEPVPTKPNRSPEFKNSSSKNRSDILQNSTSRPIESSSASPSAGNEAKLQLQNGSAEKPSIQESFIKSKIASAAVQRPQQPRRDSTALTTMAPNQVETISKTILTRKQETHIQHRNEVPNIPLPTMNFEKKSPENSTVNVTIGRIEIGTSNSDMAKAKGITTKSTSNVMSLDSYLRLRSEGKLS